MGPTGVQALTNMKPPPRPPSCQVHHQGGLPTPPPHSDNSTWISTALPLPSGLSTVKHQVHSQSHTCTQRHHELTHACVSTDTPLWTWAQALSSLWTSRCAPMHRNLCDRTPHESFKSQVRTTIDRPRKETDRKSPEHQLKAPGCCLSHRSL